MTSKEIALLISLCQFLRAKLSRLQGYRSQSSPGFFNTLTIDRLLTTIKNQVDALDKALTIKKDQVKHVKEIAIELFQSISLFATTATEFRKSYPLMLPIQSEMQAIIQDTLACTESVISSPSDFDKIKDLIPPHAIAAIFTLREELNEGRIEVISRFKSQYIPATDKALQFAELTTTALTTVYEENKAKAASKDKESADFSQQIQKLTTPIRELEKDQQRLQHMAAFATVVVRRWEEKEACGWDIGYKCKCPHGGHPVVTRQETAPDLVKRAEASQQLSEVNEKLIAIRNALSPEITQLQQGITENKRTITQFIEQNKAIAKCIRFINSLKTHCALMESEPKHSFDQLTHQISTNYPYLVTLFTLLSRNGIKNLLIFQLMTAIESSASSWIKLQNAMEDKDLLMMTLLGEAVAKPNDESESQTILINNYHYYVLLLVSVNEDSPWSDVPHKQRLALNALGSKGMIIGDDDHLIKQIERIYTLVTESISDIRLQHLLIDALQAAKTCNDDATLDDRLFIFWQTLKMPYHAETSEITMVI